MTDGQRDRPTRSSSPKGLVVVIATSGRPRLLERSLKSLAACTKPEAYMETVVVENGSRHGTQRIVESFEHDLSARYLYSHPANKSAALNLAIETLNNPLVIFTDDDVRCDRGFLDQYAVAAAKTDVPAFFGGPMGVDYERRPADWLLQLFPASAKGWTAESIGNDLLFMGINWAAYASDIRAVGGFDVHRGPGGLSGGTGQETAMQQALRAACRISVYVPEAKVWHCVPAERSTPEWLLDRQYRKGTSMGIDTAQQMQSQVALSLWVASRIIRTSVRSVLAMIDGRPERRFDAAAKREYNRGLLAGSRYHRDKGSR